MMLTANLCSAGNYSALFLEHPVKNDCEILTLDLHDSEGVYVPKAQAFATGTPFTRLLALTAPDGLVEGP